MTEMKELNLNEMEMVSAAGVTELSDKKKDRED